MVPHVESNDYKTRASKLQQYLVKLNNEVKKQKSTKETE